MESMLRRHVHSLQCVMHWMSPKERRNLGRSQRKQAGRHAHKELRPAKRRAPALELLEHSMHGRVPALIRLKYELMAESPFAYFRGAVPVMAADLASLPRTSIVTQICGDAHVRNLGAYAAPDGRLLFDINDFDETIAGPFEWDLKRMAASLVLAGRAAGHKDISCVSAVEACIASYTTLMRTLAEMPFLEVARFQVHRMDLAKPVQDALMKAERATPQHTLEKLTEPAKRMGTRNRKFKESKPMLARLPAAKTKEVLRSLRPYCAQLEPQRQHLLDMYRPVDVAFKVVGTGSVGLRDYCVYFEGNGAEDPLFLQIKEEAASAYAPYLKAGMSHPKRTVAARRVGNQPSQPGGIHNGRRVSKGQRAMQMQTDPFLGWTQFGGRQYMVRQLNDHKGSIEIDDLAGRNLEAYAEVCGELLARGHARSGDPLVISGYLGNGDNFAEGCATFGARYADQTEKDWEELKRSDKAKATT
jgi:uncharacterized protein (DUF2252 family)